YLDLEVLEKASAALSEREPGSWTIENGKVTADVTAEEGDSLLLTIPLDRGWKITVNGSSRDADVFAGTLVSIPLDPGDNHVEMTYEVPYLKLGALITLIGILLLALTGIAEALLGRKKGESFPALIKNEGESARN
ncbi:MAG: YfhO family protein, partial [Lachnospiraceae bacterium]|nr:YfhO family protein [Lachnospiraceae bacterium]